MCDQKSAYGIQTQEKGAAYSIHEGMGVFGEGGL